MTSIRLLRPVLAASLAAACLVPLTIASAAPGDSASFAEKIADMRRKAAELRADGRSDEAEKLEAEARAYEAKAAAMQAEEAQRAELKARIAALHEKARQAKSEGRMQDAEAAMREAEELSRGMKGGKAKGDGNWDTEMARQTEELRAKARTLRESGNVDDAAHLEGKADKMEKALALRRESNEAERLAKEAKAAGRADEAHALMEKSGRLWRESDELLGKPSAVKKPAPRDPLLEGTQQDVERRIAGLRNAATNLREAGMPNDAAKMEARAESLEHALRDGPLADKPRPQSSDLDGMRAELDKLRRRIAELEEELRRREGK